MRVLLGTHTFFPDHGAGTEVLTLELAKGLKRKGHEVRILTGAPHRDRPAAEEPWIDETVYEGIPVSRLHFGTARNRRPILDHLSAPERVARVLALVTRERPDLVHFNHLMGFSASVIPAVKRLGVRVLFTPTDFWTLCPTIMLYKPRQDALCSGPDPAACLQCLRPMPHLLAAAAVAMPHRLLAPVFRPSRVIEALRGRTRGLIGAATTADRILSPTPFLSDLLTGHGIDRARLHLVPYGVDTGPLPPRVPIPEAFTAAAPLRVAFIGTFAKSKGLHVLLESLKHLGGPERFEVDVYGHSDPSTPYGALVRDLAHRSPATVRFQGTFHHLRIGEILRGHHVLVVPSLWHENAPLVLCSALDAGTPVLVSDVRGLTDLIEEGRSGHRFPRGDPMALAERLNALAEAPSRVRALTPQPPRTPRTSQDYVDDVERHYLDVVKEVPLLCP